MGKYRTYIKKIGWAMSVDWIYWKGKTGDYSGRVTEIAESVFYGNVYIEYLYMPDSFTQLLPYVFNLNYQIHSVKLPANLTEIKAYTLAELHKYL